jgi:hypothetical protein
MAILVRNPKTDRKIRALAKRWDCTLQEAVDRAVSAVPETYEERLARAQAVTKEIQDDLARYPRRPPDGMTDKEFYDWINGGY